MKRLISVCFVCLLLTFAAGAANVGTIDNGYPGDTEAQAQLLFDLGLFQGTEKGFELEKPMTRAEAAVMLTRLLGAEDKALSGEWTHPFSDVPQWADKYVGWLYESGLTNGTSGTTYSPEQNITCGQYCTFLARAVTDSDEYSWLLQYGEDEEKRCDEAGFVRGDAVSLSVRLLSMQYGRVPDNVDAVLTVAHHLMDCGMYTAEQFRQATWEVLPRQYARADAYGTWYAADGALSCVIAGVRVLANETSQVVPDRDWIDWTGRLYGRITSQNGEIAVYRIDEETLETAWLFSGGSEIRLLCTAGGADYFVVDQQLLVVENDEARREPISFPKAWSLDVVSRDDTGDCWVFPSDQGICVVDDGGLRLLGTQPFNRVQKLSDLIVAQRITVQETVVSAWTWGGKAAGSFTVDNAYTIPEGMESEDAAYVAYWCSLFAPNLKSDNGTEVWGTAGLYRVTDGVLTQLTDMPVYDCKIDPTDGSYVLLTAPAEQRPYFSGSGVYTLTGTQVIRITQDGTQHMLLSDEPDHGLTFSEISLAEYGKVQVVYTYVMGMGDMHQYEYAVENGKLRALVHTPGMGYSGYTEEECAAEQARLDALGVGVGAA